MIRSLDHLVLTVADLELTKQFYCMVLGMELVQFGEGRLALKFGDQKINLHVAGKEYEPKAKIPTPGSADLCFLIVDKLATVIDRLHDYGISIVEGPVRRTGATGAISSVYVRDPDGNLIELAELIA